MTCGNVHENVLSFASTHASATVRDDAETTQRRTLANPRTGPAQRGLTTFCKAAAMVSTVSVRRSIRASRARSAADGPDGDGVCRRSRRLSASRPRRGERLLFFQPSPGGTAGCFVQLVAGTLTPGNCDRADNVVGPVDTGVPDGCGLDYVTAVFCLLLFGSLLD